MTLQLSTSCSAVDVSADVTAIRVVTDNLPDNGTLVSISDETDRIAGIETIVNNLPDSGALTSISDETDKIDSTATDGLVGTNNSLAYRVHEVERHVHSYERWLGLAAVPVGETHRADADSMAPFIMDAGNNTWGAWLQVLGSSDTPVIAGNVRFDLHRFLVTDVERNKVITRIQIGFGNSGADALATGDYTEVLITPEKDAKQNPFFIQTRRCAAGVKCWARCWVSGQDTGTVEFFYGLHEYEG